VQGKEVIGFHRLLRLLEGKEETERAESSYNFNMPLQRGRGGAESTPTLFPQNEEKKKKEKGRRSGSYSLL